MSPDTPDSRLARRTILALAESGQPPKLGARFLNVGTESILNGLRDEYLSDLLLPYGGADGSGVCKWVVANYGNGKTQFLRCMQELAWQEGYVTAFVELSQDECPLDRPDRVYGAIARGIQARPLTASDVDQGRGIDVMLRQLIDRRFDGVLTGLPNDDLKAQAIEWVKTSLDSTPIESNCLRRAVVEYLLGTLNDQPDRSRIAASFLRGEPHSTTEAKQIGLYEKLDVSSGFRFLRSLCQLLQRTGLAVGTLLLFDEARRSLSLMSNKGQKTACENLLSIINHCNSGELPGTMFLYAVMPEFFSNFALNYPALQQRCGPATRINLESLSSGAEAELLARIGDRIVQIFDIAHQTNLQADSQVRASLPIVAEACVGQSMGSGCRRLMATTWARTLEGFRADGPRLLTPEEMPALIHGANQGIDASEQSAVAAAGE